MKHKSDVSARLYLAFFIVLFVSLIGAIAIPVPGALVVFDRLLPVLMLVLGYYFGRGGGT